MWSILVASVAVFAFGALWYTVLFGKMWSRLMNLPADVHAKMKENGMVKPMALNFLANVLSATALYTLFPQLLVLSFGEFLKAVFVMWFGFSFVIYVNSVLWEGRSWKLLVLNSVSGLISATILAIVIYYMK